MEQEDKELLLRDLCARLPYGIKVNNEIQGDFKIYGICENFAFGRNEVCHIDFNIEKIKPYLFPLSSMTKEQRKELRKIMDYVEATFMNACCKGGFTLSFTNLTDWLNANHFDYRGLIPKGLAIDATGLGVYENNA